MKQHVSHDVLRRMVSPPPRAPEDVPITSSRAMRLAITRAADKTHELPLSVTSLQEEVLDLDAMLGTLGPDLMLVGMVDDTRSLLGLAALDAGLRSALIESQTLGFVVPGEFDDRAPTATDAKMSEPLLTAILHHLGETAHRTPLDGWGQGLSPMGRVPDTRSAGLILPEGHYRVLRMGIDLAVEGRTGELVIALVDDTTAAQQAEDEPEDIDWNTAFRAAVNATCVRLDAELHRFQMPLKAVQDMAVGQIVPLVGCDVASVKMRALDGRAVATARLGQSGGRRAVRIEAPMAKGLTSLEHFGDDGGNHLALMADDGAMDDGAFGMDMAMMDTDASAVGSDNTFAMGTGDLALDLPDTAPPQSGDADDETSRMLNEMEAALSDEDPSLAAWDGDAGAEAAPLDWSAELGDDSSSES